MTHLYETSFYSARNLVISASLLVVFTLLLAIATFLATKYRRKTVVSSSFSFLQNQIDVEVFISFACKCLSSPGRTIYSHKYFINCIAETFIFIRVVVIYPHYLGPGTGTRAGDSDGQEGLGPGGAAPGVRLRHGHQGRHPASRLL